MVPDAETIARALRTKSDPLGRADLERIVTAPEAVEKLIGDLPASFAAAREGANLLFSFLEEALDREPARVTAAMKTAGGALLYLASPLDLVPDQDEGGYEDDAAVVLLALRELGDELTEFVRRTKT